MIKEVGEVIKSFKYIKNTIRSAIMILTVLILQFKNIEVKIQMNYPQIIHLKSVWLQR